MLWACLHLSALPLSAVFADGSTTAHAITTGPQQRPEIALANAAAVAAGVRPGHSVAAARALCPSLHCRPRDPRAERQLLHLLGAWAYQFSGQVALAEPDTLWLEIGASLTLFGGWRVLQQRLREQLLALGHPHALAVAPVAHAARVLARCHDGIALRHAGPMLTALGQVLLDHSGLPTATIAALHGMGFRCLREIFALPRAELTRRIGPDGLRTLDCLRGLQPDALTLYRPPDRFERRIELDGHIDSWQPLLFPLRRLTRELALFLLVRDGGVQRFDLVLEHEDKAATRVPVGLLSAQREADALFEFSRGRLERATIAAEVTAIALVAADLPAFRPRHGDLFEPRRLQGLDWPELAERLRARLGDGALNGLACVAEHRPERAWRFATSDAGETPQKDKTPAASIDAQGRAERPRPLWLLARPIPLRPAPAKILAGPERIESGWWDGDDARRDYYVVQTTAGQRGWAYVPAGASDGWMLHGWFA